jgi:hypothetical protein
MFGITDNPMMVSMSIPEETGIGPSTMIHQANGLGGIMGAHAIDTMMILGDNDPGGSDGFWSKTGETDGIGTMAAIDSYNVINLRPGGSASKVKYDDSAGKIQHRFQPGLLGWSGGVSLAMPEWLPIGNALKKVSS